MTLDDEILLKFKNVDITTSSDPKSNKEKKVISYADRMFYVNEKTFALIKMIKEMDSISLLRERLKKEKELELSTEQLEETIKKIGSKLFEERLKKNYVYGKTRLINEENVLKLAKPLTFFIEKRLFFTISIISSIISVFFIFSYSLSDFFDGLYSKVGIAWGTLFMLIWGVILAGFHELGHAAASLKYNVTPKEIGFGIFIISPVFYTDVSKIWTLEPKKRNIVNIAGVYFQLILNIPLFAAMAIGYLQWGEIPPLLVLLLLTNMVMLLYCLNPLLRNDGYWLYSDFFNLPNLNSTSLNYISELYKIKEPAARWKSIKSNKALFFYSILNNIVSIIIAVVLPYLFYVSFWKIYSLIQNYSFTEIFDNGKLLVQAIKSTFLLVVTAFFSSKKIKQALRYYKKNWKKTR